MTGIDNPTAMGSSALLAALLIQYLKNSNWATWFSRSTQRANIALSVLVASVTAAGIHFQFDQAAGTLVVTGLTSAAGHAVYQTALQFSAQHVWYKAIVVVPEVLGEIRALLQQGRPLVSAAETKSLLAPSSEGQR